MSLPEEPPDVVMHDPGRGPSLEDSPSDSSSESHVSFDPANMPPDEQCTDYSTVFPGDWRQEDAQGLQELGWWNVPPNDRTYWQAYTPQWTDPAWDPTVETSLDGSMKRVIRGGADSFMRPTILPRDEEVLRTEYTKYVYCHPLKAKSEMVESREEGKWGCWLDK